MADLPAIVGIGAGGHAKVLVDALRSRGEYRLIGLVDEAPSLIGSRIGGVEVLGGDDLLPGLRSDGCESAFLGVGNVDTSGLRARIFHKLRDIGFSLPRIVHHDSTLSDSAKLGEGTAVLARAYVGPDVSIADNVIVNTGAIVEHDCVIAAHCHLSIGSVLSGGVKVASGAFVGAGAVVKQGVTIGEGALIGAGAMVVRDVPAAAVLAGVPAKPIR